MKTLISLILLVLAYTPPMTHASVWEGQRYDTSNGKVYQHLSGEYSLAASTASWSTYTITLNGTTGAVSATSIDVTTAAVQGLAVSTITVSSLTATSANIPTLTATSLSATAGTITTLTATSGSITTLGASTVDGKLGLKTYTETISSPTVSNTYDVGWSSSSVYHLNLSSSTTVSFSGATAGQSMTFLILQSSNTKTITWPATVVWPSGTAPKLSTTTAKTDIISFFYDGGRYFGFTGGLGY